MILLRARNSNLRGRLLKFFLNIKVFEKPLLVPINFWTGRGKKLEGYYRKHGRNPGAEYFTFHGSSKSATAYLRTSKTG